MNFIKLEDDEEGKLTSLRQTRKVKCGKTILIVISVWMESTTYSRAWWHLSLEWNFIERSRDWLRSEVLLCGALSNLKLLFVEQLMKLYQNWEWSSLHCASSSFEDCNQKCQCLSETSPREKSSIGYYVMWAFEKKFRWINDTKFIKFIFPFELIPRRIR